MLNTGKVPVVSEIKSFPVFGTRMKARKGHGLSSTTWLAAIFLSCALASPVMALEMSDMVVDSISAHPEVKEKIHVYRQVVSDRQIAESGWRPSVDLEAYTGFYDTDSPTTGNQSVDYDSSTLSTTFTTVTADETLSFQWAFLTDEVGPGGQGNLQYDDLFDITIDGISIVNGSVNKPGGSSPFPDTPPYDGLRYTVSSSGLTDGSDFGTATGGGRIAFQSASIAIADPPLRSSYGLHAPYALRTILDGLPEFEHLESRS